MSASSTTATALLLTGPPGVGKTTAIRRVAAALAGRAVHGFTTEEIREGDHRLGFRLETFDGRRMTLAHADIRSPHRVGRYGVDVAALDSVADSALAIDKAVEVYLVDEIGKMECLSPRFVAAMRAVLDARRVLVASVALRGGGLIEEAKRRPEVEVWTVTRETREALPERVLEWLRARL